MTIQDDFKDKRILVTGGLGFVGVNLISSLLSNNIQPIILDLIPKGESVDKRYVPFDLSQLEFFNVNLTDQKTIVDIVQRTKPDYVIHLAASTDLNKDFPTAFQSVEINIKGTLNILKSIHKFPVTRLILLSTSDVYGGVCPPFQENQIIIPASPYSVSKASAEMYSLMFNRVFDLPIVILRSFNLFGKYQKSNRVIPYIISQLIKGEEVQLTTGEQKREFNYVENLIDAIFLALKSPESQGKIINIGSGESISIRDIATKIAGQLDLTDKLNFGAIPYRKNEIWDMYCDNSQARSILQWQIRVDVDEGITRTINWFQKTFKNIQ